jgi:uncharacterized protein with von Willebrand factor type A (vWA) domain
MDKDELLRMLDLDGVGPDPPPAGLTAAAADPLAPASPPGPTNENALGLDEWGLRRGRDLLEEYPSLGHKGLGEYDLADFHAAAFDMDPQLLPGCADRIKHEFLGQLLETPEYHALHESTMLNEAAAAIAAASFAEQFARLREERREEERERSPRAGGKDPAPVPSADVVEHAEMEGEMRVVRAVGVALDGAARDVAEMEDATAALGMGPGGPGPYDPRRVAGLFRRVRKSETLRRIVELAGRYRLVAQSKQRRKVVHGMDDMVGVTLDGEIARLVPSELARLVLPEMEWDTLRRIVDRQALCRDYRSAEPVGKGPIVVSVDESGSMAGPKVHTAKALALAMAWIARHQKRWCGLVAYSGDTGHRLVTLPPGGWDEVAVLAWLEQFLSGGSDMDVPVREMPEFYNRMRAPRGDTDVLFITDAICHIPSDIQASFSDWKHMVKARLITLVINNAPGDLVAISDEVHEVPSLDVEESAVDRVLSL